MKLAVIVLNYNDYETTKDFLGYAKEFKIIDKIIVVDNASTDYSLKQLEKMKNEKIDVISAKENRGYASGNNEGILYALKKYRPEYLLISNPDIIFEEDIINEMICFLEQSNEKVGLVSGRMLDREGKQAKGSWKIKKKRDCILGNIIVPKRVKRKSD